MLLEEEIEELSLPPVVTGVPGTLLEGARR